SRDRCVLALSPPADRAAGSGGDRRPGRHGGRRLARGDRRDHADARAHEALQGAPRRHAHVPPGVPAPPPSGPGRRLEGPAGGGAANGPPAAVETLSVPVLVCAAEGAVGTLRSAEGAVGTLRSADACRPRGRRDPTAVRAATEALRSAGAVEGRVRTGRVVS